MYKSMSEEQLDEFASTKRKGQARTRREIALEVGVFPLLDAEVAGAQKVDGAQIVCAAKVVAVTIAAAPGRCRRRRQRR